MGNAWPLVGRDSEIAAIADVIGDDTVAGVILTGPAGVGKTRLAREAVAAAERLGRRGRWIAATASARPVPLGAFAQFAKRLGPDPMRRVADVVEAMIDSSVPSVVVVDDAHLLDEQSALVVQHVVRNRVAQIVLTMRAGEVVPDAVASLLGLGRFLQLEVEPLTVGDMALMAEGVLGAELNSSSVQRLSRYTRGNALFLRQLIDDELAANRLALRSGIWAWDGPRELSPTLAGLIESNIGRQSDSVLDILDLLAICDPIELPVLLRFATEADVATAERCGLVAVDTAAQEVHLAHPTFGEVRRNRAGSMHLRILRARLADVIAELVEPSAFSTVRRAQLMLESDRDVDPALLMEAVGAAQNLLNPDLAVSLAHSATLHGGGRPARALYAMTMTVGAHPEESAALLSELAATATSGAERAGMALFLAVTLTWNLGRPLASERELDAAQRDADECGFTITYTAARASFRTAAGDPESAVALATDVLAKPEIDAVATMLASLGLVGGYADLGRLPELATAADRAYAVARTNSEAAHVRFVIGLLHVIGLCLAGVLDEARAVAVELRRQSQDVGVSIALTGLSMGLVEMFCGGLASAQTWFRECLATGEAIAASENVHRFGGQWLATALAMAGQRDAISEPLDLALSAPYPENLMWEPDLILAQAWAEATRGSSSRAARLAMQAAKRTQAQNRLAREVMCLQTATQFGDTTTAERLAELSRLMPCPRADAAAAHAVALRDRDGASLLAASRGYQAFGDRVAAADAAAQAAVVTRKRRAGGIHAEASELAQRLAAETGADTLALRSAAAPPQLTARQREVAALAAAGLSNAEIAEQLVMSTRTVEGHILKAVQRSGVGSRAELVALFDGRSGEW